MIGIELSAQIYLFLSLETPYAVQSVLNINRIFKLLAKTLIRLSICAGWYETLLDTHTTLLEGSVGQKPTRTKAH